jgi:thymidylate synthase
VKTYIDNARKILAEGQLRGNRTGMPAISTFGLRMEFNLLSGFPLLTTKHVRLKSIFTELKWFLRGDTNIGFLKDNGSSIWDQWADADGEVGPMYGSQWRSWVRANGRQPSVDQIQELLKNLMERPYSRRHLVTAWNVEDLPDESISPQENVAKGKMALAPCHGTFQCYVDEMDLAQRDQWAMLHGVVYNDAVWIEMTKTQAGLGFLDGMKKFFDERNVPTKRLSLQVYQR